jgi:hypothetical protein
LAAYLNPSACKYLIDKSKYEAKKNWKRFETLIKNYLQYFMQ